MASTIYNAEKRDDWRGHKELFHAQLVLLISDFIHSDKILIQHADEDNKVQCKVLIMLNMNRIMQHIRMKIREVNSEKLTPVFDREHPIRSTAHLRTWYTSKPSEWLIKSHISHCVYDSTWEASEAYLQDNSETVCSFVKNDHLGFVIFYNHKGIIRKYYPDFNIRLQNGDYLVLEVKGKDTDQDKTRREFLAAWVLVVNEHGGFGHWLWAVSFEQSDLNAIIRQFG